MTDTPLEPDARSVTGQASAGEALREFLSAGAARCPSCGYDVHGCDGAICPECAWPLTLQLKPRVSFVPYWIFSLLINGWLFLWGTGGTLTTWLRVWQYHSLVSRKFAATMQQMQAQAAVQQFTGQSNGATAGSASGVIPPTPMSLAGNFWTYFLGQNLSDQVSVSLFFLSLMSGAAGLLMTPAMRRLSPRANAWLISWSIIVFVATMCNYVVTYATYLMRAL